MAASDRSPPGRALVCGLLTVVAACGPHRGDEPVERTASPLGTGDRLDLYVVLEGPSAAEAVGALASSGNPTSVARTRARLAELKTLRDTVRPDLLATGATVVAELARLTNAFHVNAPRHAIAKLRSISHVVTVEPVPIFTRNLQSALPVVGAPLAWAGAPPLTGDGVTIGILDTGIDYLHADFGGSGNATEFDNDDSTVVEPGTFPTARVIGGYDFAGNDYDASVSGSTPVPDDDPIDCDGHGTHVAGIAAGNGVLADGSRFVGPYEQSLDLAQFRVAPGVAPTASLYALKIFGCNGSTGLVAEGLEWAADPNDDGDFSDRIDVVNASLGSAYGNPSVANGQTIANFHTLGGLFVAAAGNDGSTFFVTGSPGSFPEALSVAASTDSAFIAVHVDAPPGIAGDYAAVEASFTAPLQSEVTGGLVRADPPLACEPLENAAAVAGRIALIDRGDCPFVDKLDHAASAGAIGAVVVNNVPDPPFAMGGSGGSVDLPAVMIGYLDGELLSAQADVQLTLARRPFLGNGTETIAGLSSRGPSTQGGLLKPEIAAPGVAIDSAAVGTGTDATSKQGTSMATPFVAGAAALVRQAQPALSPTDVKAVLMHTATTLHNGEGAPYPVSLQGGGRLDIPKAVAQLVTAHSEGPEGVVGITFDTITTATVAADSRTLVVHNHGGSAVTFQTSATQHNPLPGVTVSVSPPDLTLAAGASAELLVTLQVDAALLGDPAIDPVTAPTQNTLPRHALNEADGRVVLDDVAGEQSLSIPFYGVVNGASALHAATAGGCALASGEVVAIALEGESAHPSPSISAFELGSLEGTNIGSAKELDILAVGAATDAPIEPRFNESSVHFGIAVDGEWTTPAQGGYSLFGVAIDSNRDGVFDYTLVLEPMNREAPFFDVIATSVYDQTGQRVGSQRYANLVAANEADTRPFFNSVVVMTAFARDIGLDEDNSAFDYFVYSRGLFGVVEQGTIATFDVLHPRVDAARFAPHPGLPLYDGASPLVVGLGARDEAGRVPELLLLHHNGEPGARFEIVDVGGYATDTLTVSFEAATTRAGGKLILQNDGPVTVHDVVVDGLLDGGSATLIAPSHGSCSATPAIHCEVGSIAPGSTRTVTLEVAPTGDDTIDAAFTMTSLTGCELPFTVVLDPPDKTKEPPPLDVGGGCGCQLVQVASQQQAWLSLLCLVGLCVRRRARPRS